jgi:diguanylate cyclase (GGDEF)-like protein/hemerythrin-like metal-binding protein
MSAMLAQLDYIHFFFGLALLLLGSVSLSMSRSGPLPTPWWLLGSFAFILGGREWLELVALSVGDSRLFNLARSLLLAASFACLLEFARRTNRLVHGATLGPWIHAVPLTAVVALAFAFGPAYLESAVRLLVATPAIFWSVVLLLVIASRNEALGGAPESGRARRWSAFFLGAFGVYAGLVVPRAPFLPALWPTTEAFLWLTGFPIQLLRGLLVGCLALSIWSLAVSFEPRGSVLQKKRVLFWMMAWTIGALLLVGWLFTDWVGKLHEREAVEQAEWSTSQIYDHLADEMQETDNGVRSLAELLNHFHVAGNSLEPARLNEVVDSIAMAMDGWVVYVLDQAGRTIAASNRGRPDSFLGKNYAVRSYYKDAMAGRPGRLLAMGIVSGIPGYFASQPVRSTDGRVIGVAVVKRNLDAEQLRTLEAETAYIVSAEGRVFVASRKGLAQSLLWKAAGAPAPERAMVGEERVAARAPLDHAIVGTEWLSAGRERQIAVRRPIPGSDWSLVVIRPEKTQLANRLLGIVITLLLCTVVLSYFVAMQRQYGTESLIIDKRRQAEGRAREFARKAGTDALTGVPNRLGFNAAISREFERARRYRHPLSLMILDLDHFKQVNDVHGHLAGDRVLVGVARLIEGNIRESDLLARWGGEEFVVVATMTDGQGAARLAEKLRALMAATTLGPGGAVTGSFGVAELRSGDSIEGLLHRADEALYRAKSGGRNRVERADAGEVEVAGGGRAGAAAPGPVPPPVEAVYADTGFEPIDREHRALGQALLELVRSIEAGQAAEVQLALEAVIAGVGAHFGHEEKLMEQYDYPLRKRHQEVHALFVDDALLFLEELQASGVTVNFRRWAVGRLLEWFRFHILAYDVVLGEFLGKASAPDAAPAAMKG